MARQIQVTVPLDKSNYVLAFLKDRDHVFGLNEFPGTTSSMIIFKMAQKRCGVVLHTLTQEMGVGKDFGSIDIISLQSSIPSLRSQYRVREKASGVAKKRQYNMTDRMTVEEIYEIIDGQTHLTFDYLAMITVAALIAGVGLVSDSSVTVVASMLVSPLMGPILGVTFGATTGQWALVKRSIFNEFIGVLLCILVGVLVGLCVVPFFGPGGVTSNWATHSLTSSHEIKSRGSPWSFIGGVFVAAPSGVGVALGLTSGGINALVGVAISAALLPPIVNSGMCLVFGLWYTSFGFSAYGIEWLLMSLSSFGLFLLNFLLIVAFSMITFKVKKIKRRKLPKEGQVGRDFMPLEFEGEENYGSITGTMDTVSNLVINEDAENLTPRPSASVYINAKTGSRHVLADPVDNPQPPQ